MSHAVPLIDVVDKARELQMLQKKEMDLLAALTAINESFAEQCIPVSTHNTASGYTHATALPAWATQGWSQDTVGMTSKRSDSQGSRETGVFDVDKYRAYGIRMQNKLSFRGEDKAREYFAVLDTDHDRLLDFEECKGES